MFTVNWIICFSFIFILWLPWSGLSIGFFSFWCFDIGKIKQFSFFHILYANGVKSKKTFLKKVIIVIFTSVAWEKQSKSLSAVSFLQSFVILSIPMFETITYVKVLMAYFFERFLNAYFTTNESRYSPMFV